MPGNSQSDPTIASQTVTLDGKRSVTSNPYFLQNLTQGQHEVSVSVPDGYSVGYTLCYNRINCHNETPVMKNSVSVDVPSKYTGFADLWWHYFRN